jgi:hypothetical protein
MEAEARSNQGLGAFFVVLLSLALANVALALIPFPKSAISIVGTIVGIVFLSLPIYGLFRGGDHPWTPKLAGGFIAGGVVLQFGLGYAIQSGLLTGVVASIAGAISQIGLMLWCIGLGAILATKAIREPNLILPVSIFLIGFDILLVLTPIGTVNQVLSKAPQIFERIAYVVPKVSDSATFGPVGAAAFIGPADFVFLSMFFICLYRFGMNARGTLIALIPVLIAYMATVNFLGPLPALPPIAICVLAVNARYFKMKKDEIVATVFVALVMAGLITFGATRPKPPPAPLPVDPSPSAPEPAVKQGQVSPGQQNE